jgi:hypothetical protein
MMTVEDGSLDRRRLNKILRHVSRPKAWAAGLGTEFSLDVDALLQEDAFQKRVLVAQHQALIGRMPVSGLKIGEVLLMGADSLLELLDVLGPPFPESRLRLPVPLLPFFGCRVDLPGLSDGGANKLILNRV